MSVSSSKKLNALVTVAVMTAVICVLSPWSVPVGPVPISLATLAIYLSACLLGWKGGTISVLVYLLLGVCGVPVFAGFSAGADKVIGPTGGYLIGYLPLAFISGWVMEHYRRRLVPSIVGMVLGTVVLYLLGTAWLCVQLKIGFYQGLSLGVLPFLVGDAVKILVSAILGPQVYQRLGSAGFLKGE